MQYDSVFDKWHEECGVFGIYDTTLPVMSYAYWGLFALQHRGQESAGIAISDGTHIELVKGMGLVTEAIKELPPLKGYIAGGHVRYSTTGSNNPRNIQPLVIHYQGGDMAVAHNGNLTNAYALRKELEDKGSIFQTTMDSEVIVSLIARSKAASTEDRIIEAVNRVEGAFSLVITTNTKLIGVRDANGFRPLCLGKTANGYVISSESCALDAIKATFVRDIKPGEMVIIDENGVRSRFIKEEALLPQQSLCIFEYIYFARSDSNIDGQNVYAARINMGRELARETKYDADLVMSIPDSGTAAALGYSRESGIPFGEGLVKNRYMGRTFIKPDQSERDLAVRMKLNAVPDVVRGKRIVLVDDSIVRGTTSGIIVRMLKEAGAKEVYMCVSSPAIEYPCHYGIDTSVRKELIAATHSVEQIREYIGADKLHYLSREGLCRAIEALEERELCFACFDGHYAVEVPKEEEEGGKYVLED
ncbi:amidophosphoribosyltransferase [Veillonella magna]|uniref:Amidophosphoribosyltransferase n=1 Tax=Veillonella magna TaxID=464322 RepID=A0ABS2GIJ3_9FIRM|nr:amidophosphoribosyltransferase [Veillonella magna]MBM6824700.1 amidophosphoribosyltransferase [Veillonella magna]MBM6912994.1 amidophosphoribosyltransferase [Veillonella magna]